MPVSEVQKGSSLKTIFGGVEKQQKTIKYQPLKKTWRVTGKDCDGEVLNVICAVHEMLLIVTVY